MCLKFLKFYLKVNVVLYYKFKKEECDDKFNNIYKIILNIGKICF